MRPNKKMRHTEISTIPMGLALIHIFPTSFFQYINRYVSISRRKLSANSCSLLLPINLPSNSKLIIIFQYNNNHLNQIHSNNIPLSIIHLSFKLIQNFFHTIQTFLMRYIWIKTHHTNRSKNCRFRDIP